MSMRIGQQTLTFGRDSRQRAGRGVGGESGARREGDTLPATELLRHASEPQICERKEMRTARILWVAAMARP